MVNNFEYPKYYGVRTFEEVPFNEIDASILCQLTHLDFSLVTSLVPTTLKEIGDAYFKNITKRKLKSETKIYLYCHNLFNEIKDTPRFRNVLITRYSKMIDSEKQFGAFTFQIDDLTIIAYEGTNSYLSGWKEDAELSYKYPVPSQTIAYTYLTEEAKDAKKIYLAGHSKGGNLAVAAAMEAEDNVRNKIIAIYDFDGPGFLEKQFNSRKYQTIAPKIKKFVPEVSAVGVLLYSVPNFTVIKSTGAGIMQHHSKNWACFGSYFITSTLNKKSVIYGKEIKQFIKDYSAEELEEFINKVFTILNNEHIYKLQDVTIRKIVNFLNGHKELKEDSKTKEMLLRITDMLLGLYNAGYLIDTSKKKKTKVSDSNA